MIKIKNERGGNALLLGKKLKNIRIKKKYSQDNVADFLHISRQSVSKWENDSSYPDLDNLVKLSEYYEVSIDDLLKNNYHF
jgi:transcriptional regulator with XRE-family HTH domain